MPAFFAKVVRRKLRDLRPRDMIDIQSFLWLARFPNATEEQLREAHAYAYGGSAIQDMGYKAAYNWEKCQEKCL